MTPALPAFRLALVTLATAAVLAGCGSTPSGDGTARAQGEQKLNGWIGRTVANTFLDTDPLIQKRDYDASRLQYVMPDQNGCTIGFIVDRKTKIMLSWSYLRAPEQCWTSQGSSF